MERPNDQNEAHPTQEFVTALLEDVAAPDRSAVEQLIPHLYAELRRIADHLFAHQPGHHTLQPTAIVHEAYLKLADRIDVRWSDQQHFLALAAKVMRELLADYARRRNAAKRGGGMKRFTLIDDAVAGKPGMDLLDFHDALARLEELNPRHAQAISMSVLAGMSAGAIAEHLSVSQRTVELDLRAARAWLRTELSDRDAL